MAVTSCSVCAVSAARRSAARATWVRQILDDHSNIDVRFVLAQPSPSDRQAWDILRLAPLSREPLCYATQSVHAQEVPAKSMLDCKHIHAQQTCNAEITGQVLCAI